MKQKTWSVVLLNKKYIYSYLKCIVYDKLLKPQQSFSNNPVYHIKIGPIGCPETSGKELTLFAT